MKLHEEKEYFYILVVGIGPTTLHDKGNETICEQCCYVITDMGAIIKYTGIGIPD